MKIIINKKRILILTFFCLTSIFLLFLNKNLYVISNTHHPIYFALSIIFTILLFTLFVFKVEFESTLNRFFSLLSYAFSILSSCFIVELLNENNLFSISFTRLILNSLIALVFYLVTFCLTNRIKFSIIFSNIIIFSLGFINYIVMSFRNSPLVPWDVLSIRTAANVASTYTLTINFYPVLATITFALFITLVAKTTYKFSRSKKNIIMRILLLTISIAFIFNVYKTDLIEVFDLDTNLWEPVAEYRNNGFLVSFVKQSKNLVTTPPKEYSIEKLREIASSIPESTCIPYEHSPNIIVIMNESYSDLSVNGDFSTNEEYMSFFKNLSKTENVISGNTYVSVFGGQTPNSEWEFLTNNSMAFMPYRSVPYQQYLFNNSYSLVNTLESQGYTSYAIHPWYASGYRRTNVYNLFGFDVFYSIENMNNLSYIRDYPDDISTYDAIIKLFEEKNASEKIFNFTITMQNHSGYDFAGMESEVHLTDIKDCPNVEQYLTLIKKSDEALEYLIQYFENFPEDTVILFFGDHQPPYLEETFWNAVTGYEGYSESQKYITPFVLWANYDIEEKYIDAISLNYLSILLVDTANLKSTKYMDFLREIQNQIPVITGNGYMDKEKQFHNFFEVSKDNLLIRNYEILQYNNVFDYKNRVNNIFNLK